MKQEAIIRVFVHKWMIKWLSSQYCAQATGLSVHRIFISTFSS